MTSVSSKLGGEFSVNKVEFKFFNRIDIRDVLIKDIQGDTLFYVPRVQARISHYSRKSNTILFSRVSLEQPKIYFKKDSSGNLNLNFISNRLRKDSLQQSRDKSRLHLAIRNIDMTGGSFRLQTNQSKAPKQGINFNNLKVDQIHLKAKKFLLEKGVVDLQVSSLYFRESSGFYANSVRFDLEIAPDHLIFKNNRITTLGSYISAPTVAFKFHNYKEFSDFIHKVKMEVKLDKGTLTFADLAYFTHFGKDHPGLIQLTGNYYGTVSNFHARNLEASYGAGTSFSGTCDISGLPDPENTFWFIDFKNLTVQPDDVARLINFGQDSTRSVPETYRRLGTVQYAGNFSGFYNDFVSYGKITTDLGNLVTDISFKPDSAKTIAFQGTLNVLDFMVGKLLPRGESFGEMNMLTQLNGTRSADGVVKSNLSCLIHNLEFNEYNYSHIVLKGDLFNQSFDGKIAIEDPNIKFDFLGLVDFTSESPEVDFTLNLARAKLYPLHIEEKDTTAELSLLGTANFIGNNIDNMNGSMKLINSQYKSQGETLDAYDFDITAHNRPDSSSIDIQTDYLDALLFGDYKFNKILPAIKYLQAILLPSTITDFPDTSGLSENHFKVNIHFKNTEKLSHFFFPDFQIAPESRATGTFYPAEKHVGFRFLSDEFVYKKHTFYQPSFHFEFKNDKNFTLAIRSDKLLFNDRTSFADPLMKINIWNDTIQMNLNWGDHDSLLNSGQLNLAANFRKDSLTNTPVTKIHFNPTVFFQNGEKWAFNGNDVNIDSNAIHVNQLALTSQDKLLNIHGTISEDPNDTLHLEVQDFNFANENLLKGKLSLKGIINGNTKFTGLYKQPLFFSDLHINKFEVNRENMGKAEFKSEWDSKTNALNLTASTGTEKDNGVQIDGKYFINGRLLDLRIRLKGLHNQVFHPFLKSFSAKQEGTATGKLTLTGPLKNPQLNGQVKLKDSEILIDYMNTRYSFNDDIKISNNKFLLYNLVVQDTLGNQATGNGIIDAKDFRSMAIDLKFTTDHLLMLDLDESQNDLFYGTAFGAVIVSITGGLDALKLNIAATTSGQSQIYLPLSGNNIEKDISFVHFVKEESKDTIRKAHFLRKTAVPKKGNLSFSIDITATPEAKAYVLFDPNAGGSVIARGSGNLRMAGSTNGNFSMFGEYILDQGTYNFSLSNVVNKKFEVKTGSKITWTGVPEDATLDLTAVYKLRTSLYNLLYDEAYKKRIPVHCNIRLTGKLESPDITFSIELPTADEDTKTRVENAITTENDLNKQFLSLLIVNSFMPEQGIGSAGASPFQGSVGVTTAELLSNQLSNWVSQISNDFDIGFHYRPGDDVSSQEVEVALSTQILNDRVLINSNIDVGANQYNNPNSNSEIAGNFSVEVKIDKSGKIRVKGFTRPNDKLIYESAPYTSGIGLFFREEFNSFGDLIRSYWGKVFKKKKKEGKSSP